jgi:hypothetical protein
MTSVSRGDASRLTRLYLQHPYPHACFEALRGYTRKSSQETCQLCEQVNGQIAQDLLLMR